MSDTYLTGIIAPGTSPTLGFAGSVIMPRRAGAIINFAVKRIRAIEISETLTPLEEEIKSLLRNCAEFRIPPGGGLFFLD